MFELVALLVGALAGFVGSRLLRRPSAVSSAPAAAPRAGSPARPLGGPARSSTGDLRHAAVIAVVAAAQGRPTGGPLPAAFVVGLALPDFATIAAAPGSFAQQVEQAYEQWAHGHGLALAGRPRVAVREDPALTPGRPRAAVTGPPPAPPARPTAPPSAPSPAPPPARPTPGPAELVGSDPAHGRHHLRPGDGAVVVGRASTATVRVDDGHVSRTHATFRAGDDGWTVTDERSSNGTTLNGSPLAAEQPTPLHDGDRIAIGPATFTFRQTTPDPDVTRAVDMGR